MSDELYHHGIMGMHWGVRRFQNADGTLTPKGKARMKKVESSKFASYMDTRAAKSIHKINARDNKTRSNITEGSIASLNNKKSKIENKRSVKEEKGKNVEKLNKKVNKIDKKIDKLKADNKVYKMAEKYHNKRFEDIDKGKLKAGRDFIVQRDTDIYIVPLPHQILVVGKETKTMVYKKKQKY